MALLLLAGGSESKGAIAVHYITWEHQDRHDDDHEHETNLGLMLVCVGEPLVWSEHMCTNSQQRSFKFNGHMYLVQVYKYTVCLYLMYHPCQYAFSRYHEKGSRHQILLDFSTCIFQSRLLNASAPVPSSHAHSSRSSVLKTTNQDDQCTPPTQGNCLYCGWYDFVPLLLCF